MLKLDWQRQLVLFAAMPCAFASCGDRAQETGVGGSRGPSAGANAAGTAGIGIAQGGDSGAGHDTATGGKGVMGGSNMGGRGGGGQGEGLSHGGSGASHHSATAGTDAHDGGSAGKWNVALGDGAILVEDCTVNTPTRWTAGVYVALCPIEVESTLTIDPGAIIKFDSGGYLNIRQQGKLLAVGNESLPIVFTSFNDDEHGGDSNANGPSIPAKNDWGCQDSCGDLNIEGAGSVLDYVQDLYGNNGVYVKTGTVQVTHSVFAHHKNYGLVLDAGISVQTITIADDTFFDNDGYPLRMGTPVFLDATTIFHDPANPETRNGKQCVELDADIDQITWLGVSELGFLFSGHKIRAGLLIPPETILKAQNDLIYLEASGSFVNGPSMILTSYKDDSVGGDCTGDGDTPPAVGDWKGLWVEDGTSAGYAASSDNIRYAANYGTMQIH